MVIEIRHEALALKRQVTLQGEARMTAWSVAQRYASGLSLWKRREAEGSKRSDPGAGREARTSV